MEGSNGRPLRIYFLWHWTSKVIVAWTAGLLLVYVSTLFTRFPLNLGWIQEMNLFYVVVNLVLLLLIGALVGFLQWHFVLKGIVNERRWIFATAIVGILFYLVIRFLVSHNCLPPLIE